MPSTVKLFSPVPSSRPNDVMTLPPINVSLVPYATVVPPVRRLHLYAHRLFVRSLFLLTPARLVIATATRAGPTGIATVTALPAGNGSRRCARASGIGGDEDGITSAEYAGRVDAFTVARARSFSLILGRRALCGAARRTH